MIRQVSIFMENQEGRLNNLLKILAENKLNIRSLNIAETIDYGIVRLILQETDRGMAVLKEHTIISSITPVLAAEISDQPGGLSLLVDALTQAHVNIDYAYSFLPKKTENAIIILRIEDSLKEKAITTLEKAKGITLLDRDTLLLK